MYTIGDLCREFKFSRSTLLYYDKIGLLKAHARSDSKYRLYSEADRSRLAQICALREAGVALDQIKEILDSDGGNEVQILERRLNEINREIRYLRLKQKMIVEMLKDKNIGDKKMPLDRQTFTSILKSSGLDEAAMESFHIRLEQDSPDSHQFLLEFLGFAGDEINRIREASRSATSTNHLT